MMMKRALVSGAIGLGTALGGVAVATPAEAAPRVPVTCTYELDQAAGTLEGSCTGKITAEFSGSLSGDTASGQFAIHTWLGDINGSFTGSGFADGGAATVTYLVTTWFGTFSGTVGTTQA